MNLLLFRKATQLAMPFRQDVKRPGVRGGLSVRTDHKPPDLGPNVVRSAPGEARPMPGAPLVIAYGAGVDSTAVLVEMVRRGIRPDAILFADPGNEHPETYSYLFTIERFLEAHGFPHLTVVRRQPPRAPYSDLLGNCLANETLPSVAFGPHACSIEWKGKVQDRWVERWPGAQETFRRGGRVLRVIGYDAGDRDTVRACNTYQATPDKHYAYWYPLQEWGIDREEAKRRIAAAGLPVPHKSACIFCPSAHAEEIDELAAQHPDLAARALAMEDRARGGKHPLRPSTRGADALGMSLGAPWRTRLAQVAAVRAELDKLPPEQKWGSVLSFRDAAVPEDLADTSGSYRVTVAAALEPGMVAAIGRLTSLHGRVQVVPGDLEAGAAIRAAAQLVEAVKNKRRLYVEAPGADAASQDEALRLVANHAPELRALIMAGARLLVPMLPGPRPLSAVYRRVTELLGTVDVVAAVPVTTSAEQLRDLASHGPTGIHLLGTRPLALGTVIHEVSPPTAVTGDDLVKAALVRAAEEVFMKAGVLR